MHFPYVDAYLKLSKLMLFNFDISTSEEEQPQ